VTAAGVHCSAPERGSCALTGWQPLSCHALCLALRALPSNLLPQPLLAVSPTHAHHLRYLPGGTPQQYMHASPQWRSRTDRFMLTPPLQAPSEVAANGGLLLARPTLRAPIACAGCKTQAGHACSVVLEVTLSHEERSGCSAGCSGGPLAPAGAGAGPAGDVQVGLGRGCTPAVISHGGGSRRGRCMQRPEEPWWGRQGGARCAVRRQQGGRQGMLGSRADSCLA
jgi:hypothetical protein